MKGRDPIRLKVRNSSRETSAASKEEAQDGDDGEEEEVVQGLGK